MLPALLAGDSGYAQHRHAMDLLDQFGLAGLAKQVPGGALWRRAAAGGDRTGVVYGAGCASRRRAHRQSRYHQRSYRHRCPFHLDFRRSTDRPGNVPLSWDRQRSPSPHFLALTVTSKPIRPESSEVATQHGAPVISGDAERCPNHQPPCYPAAYIACAAGRHLSRRRGGHRRRRHDRNLQCPCRDRRRRLPDSRSHAAAYRW